MDVMLPSPKPIRDYMRRYGLSQSEFGDLVGASQSAVSQWLKRKTRMSAQRAKLIEERTGGEIKRVQILPKLFGGAA